MVRFFTSRFTALGVASISALLSIKVARAFVRPILAIENNPFSRVECISPRHFPTVALMTRADNDDDIFQNEEEDEDQPIIQTSTLKIDDGGSNLTNRFKYKVNALMGVFNPTDGADDERQDGNILNAILNFPVRYTFNIVGRTSGDDAIQDEYIKAVKKIVVSTAGDDEVICKVIPRGNNFLKLQCEVEVQSATMINTIYDDLDKLERTVMRF